MPTPEPLHFKVAPNIVEDLGLNLYTDLPRVLAEFVANAYDADSPTADVRIDHEAIHAAREEMRRVHRSEFDEAELMAKDTRTIQPLAVRSLPSEHTIVIEDAGHGMSRDELGSKFLVAGRRRRAEDGEPITTARKRFVMGRKGLGKLAGFGVAKRVEVVTRREGESHATKITLAYEELIKKRKADDYVVPEERLEDGGGFPTSGTRITLSELLFDPAKSQATTISNQLKDHFEFIDPADFRITLNGVEVEPLVRTFAFAWPEPTRDLHELVEDKLPLDEGGYVRFKYRMRFTEPKKSLPGQRRGVRVYARKRLASAPSLLDANTNMHGFRMTDYLDGVVEADFLDNYPTDLIATDRQSLRWDSPLLTPLRNFLSDQITEACKAAQRERDEVTPVIVKGDAFTLAEIAKHNLVGKDETMALRIGTLLAQACKRGVDDPDYKRKLSVMLQGIGQGSLLTAIAKLAAENRPDFDHLAAKIVELTHEEMEGFLSFAKGRIEAITALKKIVEDADFKKKKEEKKVQKLLEGAPWMIDPTYGPAVSADVTFGTLFTRLAKELKIGKHAGAAADKKKERPDLVFLLGAAAGIGQVVIVELKAANVPLTSTHLDQLNAYMRKAKKWLKANAKDHEFAVRGHLIGMLDIDSGSRGSEALMARIDEAGPDTAWTVRSFTDVLTQTRHAHAEILAASERAAKKAKK